MSPVPRDPAAALDRLVRNAPGAEPEVWESAGPPEEGAPDDALDFLFRRLRSEMEELVGAVREEWGDPAFQGTVEEPNFPPWSEALVLAYWKRGDAVTYLAVNHEDPGRPVTLEAGALAPQEVAQLQAWNPALR